MGRLSGVLRVLVCCLSFFALTSPSAAQTPANVLVVGQIAEPKSLDPHAVTALNDFRILINLYDGLVRYKDGTLEVEPALAESWTISDDGKIYTFTLRKGVLFHDGAPLTAEAVKFNFERMLDENHPYHDTGPFPLAFFFSPIEKVEAIDDLQIRFVLKAPYAPFLSNLAYPTGLIISPDSVKKYAKDYGRHPAGTGPFRFAEWVSNAKVVIVRNENYWDDAPPLEAVVFRPITDANTRMAEMLSGGVDLMVETPPDNLAVFEKDPGFQVYQQAGPHLWFLILNNKKGPFADRRMRQAINYAIDKKALVENVLQGTAEIAKGPIPPAFAWAYNTNLDTYAYNPDKARALIKAAGREGAQLTFYVTEGGSGMLEPVAIGAAIQADLAKVGLQVKIVTYEWNTFLSKVNPGLPGDVDMAEMAWMTNDPDTLPYLALRSDAWPDKGGFNSGYYANPKVDDLLERARRATDQDERATLYKEMQFIVEEDAPWAFIANWKQNAVSNTRVKNFKLQPSFFLDLTAVNKL
ncbi:ABC-type dipeptide transport system, periplasmic component [Hahella chejuensis KCTC 2396]|uniref:ABC-type dipeptide transport system, periplasmic component n=1 Tax=Hahella chejuensis (strain KCTC 2396) TaxID=349521 RepID=Q2SQY8_HAHCH|nr:ABC transporter substrate-binding protein [Hahella chejuensis]ABC26936.1 ABC-type dipeptide transport system, periplasmic component [Hahella chejuensis KCTC 2396]